MQAMLKTSKFQAGERWPAETLRFVMSPSQKNLQNRQWQPWKVVCSFIEMCWEAKL